MKIVEVGHIANDYHEAWRMRDPEPFVVGDIVTRFGDDETL